MFDRYHVSSRKPKLFSVFLPKGWLALVQLRIQCRHVRFQSSQLFRQVLAFATGLFPIGFNVEKFRQLSTHGRQWLRRDRGEEKKINEK